MTTIPTSEADRLKCPTCGVSLREHKASLCLDKWVWRGVLDPKLMLKRAPKISRKPHELYYIFQQMERVEINRGFQAKLTYDSKRYATYLLAEWSDLRPEMAVLKAALLIAYGEPQRDEEEDEEYDGARDW